MKDCRLDYLAAIEALRDRVRILNDVADGDYTTIRKYSKDER